MGLFGAKKIKCTKCKRSISLSSEESIRSMPDYLAGSSLRDSMPVTCGKCGKIFCVSCIELAGNHQRGGLPCPSCHGQMGVDLPAVLPLLRAYLMRMHPGLNAGQLEALTNLTSRTLARGTYYIRGMLNDKSLLDLISKINAIDANLARYLTDRSQIDRNLIVAGLPD